MARGERGVDAGPILERIAYHVRHLRVRSMDETLNTRTPMELLVSLGRWLRLNLGAQTARTCARKCAQKLWIGEA